MCTEGAHQGDGSMVLCISLMHCLYINGWPVEMSVVCCAVWWLPSVSSISSSHKGIE